RSRARLLQLTPQAVAAPPALRAAMLSVTEALESLGTGFRDRSRPPMPPYRATWAVAHQRTERTVLEGHTGWVNAVCKVPVAGGRTLLATASADRTVRLWDPLTGTAERTLEGHTGRGRAGGTGPVAGGRTL